MNSDSTAYTNVIGTHFNSSAERCFELFSGHPLDLAHQAAFEAELGPHLRDLTACPIRIPPLDARRKALDIGWDETRLIYGRGIVYPADIHQAIHDDLAASHILKYRRLLVRKLASFFSQDPPHHVATFPGLPPNKAGYYIVMYAGRVDEGYSKTVTWTA
ncbi:hypothetical protein B0H17DRAFT_1191030 [Mycena rosella]|uniref:Uncharacterized protein n=1 Tax=Mycena rosella TaxID=1033263 RepID=A0AAD7H1T4_MYCRO|nr:hypothetical protein B0H17DRAFT_1191030 [Mycena rosella]